MAVLAGIYFNKDDNDGGFKGECFCLSGPENAESLDGILRGYRVTAKNDGKGMFVVKTPLQEETLTISLDSGVHEITCAPSGSTFQQMLVTTDTENMCIDIDTYAGLWRVNPGVETLLTANGYYWVPTTVDTFTPCRYATKVTETGGVVTMASAGGDLEFNGGQILGFSKDYDRVGKLGERAGPNDYYDHQVFSNGTYGLVFAYESGVFTGYVGPFKDDATKTANWDRDKTVAVNFGTALTFGDETNGTACFLGEYAYTGSARMFAALGMKDKMYVQAYEYHGSYQDVGLLDGVLPTPTTPSPPSGGGGGKGGGGGDDTGLMVALLLGLLGYALLKS
jgi:hypothetical protein